MSDEVRTAITRHGQAYIDVPIKVQPRIPDAIDVGVKIALGQQIRIPPPLTVGHERTFLNWVRPK